MPSLDKITLKGFKSIKDLTNFELRKLNVMIGANGAGKTNFLSFFHLLYELIDGRFQHYVRKQAGANSLLHYGLKHTKTIEAALDFRELDYALLLEPDKSGGLFFRCESGKSANGIYSFDDSVPHLESRLITSLTGVREAQPFKPILETLQTCRVYHFNDTSETAGIKQSGPLNDNRFLRPDASNLAALLRVSWRTQPQRYMRIRETIQLAVPFFDDFLLEPLVENPEQIRLEWREKGSDFPFLAHHLSDGTLRFIALTVLLLQPVLPSMIILDEPELGLHPVAIELLASLLHEAAQQTQVVAATQSPALLNHFEPEEVIVVDRANGESRFRRLESEPLREWLEDYSLGELVQKNVIEAGPRHE